MQSISEISSTQTSNLENKEEKGEFINYINPEGKVVKLPLCQICREILISPIFLSCGHLYCFSCLAEKNDEVISCTVCQESTTSVQKRPEIEEHIKLNIGKELYEIAVREREEIIRNNTSRMATNLKILLGIDIPVNPVQNLEATSNNQEDLNVQDQTNTISGFAINRRLGLVATNNDPSNNTFHVVDRAQSGRIINNSEMLITHSGDSDEESDSDDTANDNLTRQATFHAPSLSAEGQVTLENLRSMITGNFLPNNPEIPINPQVVINPLEPAIQPINGIRENDVENSGRREQPNANRRPEVFPAEAAQRPSQININELLRNFLPQQQNNTGNSLEELGRFFTNRQANQQENNQQQESNQEEQNDRREENGGLGDIITQMMPILNVISRGDTPEPSVIANIVNSILRTVATSHPQFEEIFQRFFTSVLRNLNPEPPIQQNPGPRFLPRRRAIFNRNNQNRQEENINERDRIVGNTFEERFNRLENQMMSRFDIIDAEIRRERQRTVDTSLRSREERHSNRIFQGKFFLKLFEVLQVIVFIALGSIAVKNEYVLPTILIICFAMLFMAKEYLSNGLKKLETKRPLLEPRHRIRPNQNIIERQVNNEDIEEI